jgi:hypothetical protein
VELSGCYSRAEREALVEWLREGGHGACITIMREEDGYEDEEFNRMIHTVLRKRALPSLTTAGANLERRSHRAALTEGLFRGMHELHLEVLCYANNITRQLAALGLVRQLPALAKLEVVMRGENSWWGNPNPAHWPPFLPPSLRALRIVTRAHPVSESFLPALPALLEASGARLERLEIDLPEGFQSLNGELVHVAQALRCCSPTLKALLLTTENGAILIDEDEPDDEIYQERVERLRVQWADVLAGVSACRELQGLLIPPYMKVEPLFSPRTVFGRLTHLHIRSWSEDPKTDDAGAIGVWELMASGGLPALATLKVRLQGQAWEKAEEVRSRVAPAFEAVAGTLTHLDLAMGVRQPGPPLHEVRVGYEVGVAVGKLRRLKDLALDLFDDGRVYHAVAQGLATSGGDRPLPLLWRLEVVPRVHAHADQVASLLLPSVGVFMTSQWDMRQAVLMACGVRQAGYRHVWAVGPRREEADAARAIAQCTPGEWRGRDVFHVFSADMDEFRMG